MSHLPHLLPAHKKRKKKNQDQDQTNQDSHLLSMTVSMKISQSDHI